MKPYGHVDDDDNGDNVGNTASDMARVSSDLGLQPELGKSLRIGRTTSATGSSIAPDTGSTGMDFDSHISTGLDTGTDVGDGSDLAQGTDLTVSSADWESRDLDIRDTSAVSGELVDVSASDDPDEIRAGIEQTRTVMSDTINAIQDKLNPQALMEQAKDTLHTATSDILEQAKDTLHDATTGILDNAKDTVREATVGRVEHMVSNATDSAKSTGTGIVDLVKQNPLPAAALGLGLTWLLNRNRGGSSGSRGSYQPQNYGGQGYGSGQQGYGGQNYGYGQGYSNEQYQGGQGGQGMMDQVVGGIRQNPMPSALAGLGLGWWLMNRQGSSGSGGQGQMHPSAYSGYRSTLLSAQPYPSQSGGVGSAVGRVGDKVGDVAGQAGDTVGQIAGQVGDKAGDVAGTVGDAVGKAGDAVGSAASNVAETAGNVVGAVAQTAGNVAGGTGNVAGSLLKTISDNPLPAALAGISVAYIIMQHNSTAQHTLHQAGHVAGNVVSTAGDTVGTVAGAAGEAVGNVAGAAGGAVGTAAGAAGDAVGNVASSVKEGTQQAQTQLQMLLLDNPLAVGAIAAAIGAAVGLAIPETPQEHQLMGQARDALLDRAGTAAQDTLQKVQQVASEAGDTIQREAQQQGLA